MQPLSLLPGTAADSDSTAVPLSLSASATVPDAKLSPALTVVALNAALVWAPASTAMSMTAARISPDVLSIAIVVAHLSVVAGFPGEVVRAAGGDGGVGVGDRFLSPACS
jgi:hypothetical protein